MIMDSCAGHLSVDNVSIVPVDTQTVLNVPTLKSRATVECTKEYVYSTAFRQGVKYEWMHYLDGRVYKTVSYEYEERTSEFQKYTYSITNTNNESLSQSRTVVEEKTKAIHVGDMIFGMAVAVVLMMIGFIVVRAIKRP